MSFFPNEVSYKAIQRTPSIFCHGTISRLDSTGVSLPIDIGFGDIVYPGPEESDLPTMPDLPAPRLLGYSRESAIAEKFEAMVKLGALNS